jgi:hypothetical protein
VRKWVKYTLAVVAVLAIGFMALAGTGAYLVFRHLETRTVAGGETKPDFDTIAKRFAGRPPLVEIVDLQKADVRINRSVHPQGRRANTVYILNWNAEQEKLVKTDVPLWLMQFSSINVLSHLGLAPEKFRLTAEDLARYGPGIVVDYRKPGSFQVLIWVE